MAEIAHQISRWRVKAFKQAAFQGGTSLPDPLLGVARFSEDLDFILKGHRSPDFCLESFLKGVQLEFAAYGIELSVEDRTKAGEAVQKAFLKSDSVGKLLSARKS